MTYSERVVYACKVFKTEHTQKRWIPVVHLLGVQPDKKIAKKLRVTPGRVCSVRRSLGIAPVSFPLRCAEYGVPEPVRPLIITNPVEIMAV